MFRLDEGSGTTAQNSSNGEGENDGSYEEGVALAEPGAISESQAVHLDGVDDYIDLTPKWDPREFLMTGCVPTLSGYSIELWVKFDAEASGREELFSRSEEGEGVYLYRSADGRLNFTVGNPIESPTASTDEPVSDGGWHHVVATIEEVDQEICASRALTLLSDSAEPDPIEAPRIVLYVDGFAYPLGFSRPMPWFMPSARNLVGARSSEGGPVNLLTGSVDDVAIYGEPLEEADVEAHFAAGDIPPPAIILTPLPEEDSDEDGLGDRADNCPEVSNPEQEDSDFDGEGDACQVETDTDEDGVADEDDNCPEVANSEQIDSNENGIGDLCEEEE
jgi:hypothetical protein